MLLLFPITLCYRRMLSHKYTLDIKWFHSFILSHLSLNDFQQPVNAFIASEIIKVPVHTVKLSYDLTLDFSPTLPYAVTVHWQLRFAIADLSVVWFLHISPYSNVKLSHWCDSREVKSSRGKSWSVFISSQISTQERDMKELFAPASMWGLNRGSI